VDRIRIGFNADPDPAFCLNADADRQIHGSRSIDFAVTFFLSLSSNFYFIFKKLKVKFVLNK
jgi:hypothetical protein